MLRLGKIKDTEDYWNWNLKFKFENWKLKGPLSAISLKSLMSWWDTDFMFLEQNLMLKNISSPKTPLSFLPEILTPCFQFDLQMPLHSVFHILLFMKTCKSFPWSVLEFMFPYFCLIHPIFCPPDFCDLSYSYLNRNSVYYFSLMNIKQ